MANIIDRVRSMLGGPKQDVPVVDPDAVAQEEAVRAVERELERAREKPLSGELDTPGASDGSALR